MSTTKSVAEIPKGGSFGSTLPSVKKRATSHQKTGQHVLTTAVETFESSAKASESSNLPFADKSHAYAQNMATDNYMSTPTVGNHLKAVSYTHLTLPTIYSV